MQDEIFDRTYQAGRSQLNTGIDRALGAAFRAAVDGFNALHRRQWSAPWNSRSNKAGCA